jgi:hypothetical protein
MDRWMDERMMDELGLYVLYFSTQKANQDNHGSQKMTKINHEHNNPFGMG